MVKKLLILIGVLCFSFSAAFAIDNTVQSNIMPLVTIDQKDHHVLRVRANPVHFPLNAEAKKTIVALKSTFVGLESPYGKPAGLAAPQIGVPLRIIIIQIPEEAKQKRQAVYDMLPPTVFINPSYTPYVDQGKYRDWEGCYSVPNKMGEVERYNTIDFSAYTEDGHLIHRIAKGFLARLLQHEIDHLNGKLYIDYYCDQCRFGNEKTILALRK